MRPASDEESRSVSVSVYSPRLSAWAAPGRLRRRILELEQLTAKLYEDKVGGSISEAVFTMLLQKNERERTQKAERLGALLAEVDKAQQDVDNIQAWTAAIRKYLTLEDLDRETVEALIDHIEVGERSIVDGQRRQDIKICYRFIGQIEGGAFQHG